MSDELVGSRENSRSPDAARWLRSVVIDRSAAVSRNTLRHCAARQSTPLLTNEQVSRFAQINERLKEWRGSSFGFIMGRMRSDSPPVIAIDRVESPEPPPGTRFVDALRNDPAALDRLVRAEIPRVERLLLRILGPRRDLADLVQTVFLELCRALPNFRGESSFSTFVGGITVRVARRAMRPSLWLVRRSPMPDDAVDASSDPERSTEQSERVRRSQKLLAKLSPDKRIAFALWAFEGLDMQTVANMTGASLSATRSRVFYAQKELRAHAANDPYLRELLGGDDER